MTPEQELAYVAAFFDAEGHVTLKALRKGSGKLLRHVGFCNTDFGLFTFVCDVLEKNGVPMHRRPRGSQSSHHKPRWDGEVAGGKESYRRFAEIIPLQHSGKKARLQAMLDDYAATEAAGRVRRVYTSSRWTNVTVEVRKAYASYMRAQRNQGCHP